MSEGAENTSSSEQYCRDFLSLFLSGTLTDQKKGYSGLYKIISKYANYRFNSHNEDFRQDVVQIALTKIDKAGRNSPEAIEFCNAWIRTIVERVGIEEYRKKEKFDKARHLQQQGFADFTQKSGFVWLEDEDVAECLDLILAVIEQETTGPDDLSIIEGIVLGESHSEIAAKTERTEGAIATRVNILRNKMKKLRDELC